MFLDLYIKYFGNHRKQAVIKYVHVHHTIYTISKRYRDIYITLVPYAYLNKIST